ncbi:MAG: LEA type 2 family protein [Desulfobulbaceae bacterium]|nr:LEA type 2 family protein [Desulfobulbaceae bacterium]
MARKYTCLYFQIFLLLLCCSCAAIQPGYTPPSVNVVSFKALPNQGVFPRFEIGLHVINPNRAPLDLQGIAYTVEIHGHRILTGVANDLPRIEGYGEKDVLLNASTDLISSISLIADLMKKKQESFEYTLDAKLDPGGLHPAIHVREKGTVSLSTGENQIK